VSLRTQSSDGASGITHHQNMPKHPNIEKRSFSSGGLRPLFGSFGRPKERIKKKNKLRNYDIRS
jgi:hypothetical protein